MKFRSAARMIRVAQRFHSTIVLKCGEKIADVRSIMSIVMLCATMGAVINIEADGEDEDLAIQAITQVFTSGEEEPE
ncbi:MAG: HPr family phosphocarrier protein [Verrucomicrobiales bacterium]|nr:HPr family phosphocarrier protein [Verrucomicrobiales bacterium]